MIRFRFFLFVTLFLIPLASLWDIYYSSFSIFPLSDVFVILLERLPGLLLFSFMATSLLLGIRLSFFDRLIGLPAVIRIHKYLGSISVYLILIHGILFIRVGEPLQKWTGIVAGGLSLLLVLVALGFMAQGYIAKTAIFKKRQRSISYQKVKRVHSIGFFIIILVSTYHVHNADSIQQSIFSKYLLVSYGIFVCVLYIVFKIKTYQLRFREPFKIQKINFLSDGIYEISLKGNTQSTVKPGQYVYIAFAEGELRYQYHPFSTVSYQNGILKLIIKENGLFTKMLGKASPCDSISVSDGYGDFYYKKSSKQKRLLLIASGVGITPFLGMLETFLADEDDQTNLSLLWYSKSGFYYKDFFEKIKELKPSFEYELLEGHPKHIAKNSIFSAYLKMQKNNLYVCGGVFFLNILKQNIKKSKIRLKTESFH